MLPSVLILTGTCGVGKSTTSRAWATIRGGAVVVGDDIRNWIRNPDVRHARGYQQDVLARIAATAVEEFVALGLDVAIDSVWTPASLRYLTERLSPIATVRMVWLRCGPSENQRRDAQRKPPAFMGPRVASLLAELDAITDWPAKLRTLDTTGLAVDEVLAAIDR